MHHITIRDQVCNVMASLTKTFLSVPRLSCKTLKRSLLADYHSCCMPFSMVGSTGTVLQNDESAPCKRAVPAKGLPTNSTIQKSVTPNALEMLTVMFARTVQVANKKCSCQPQQRNVMLKCYPQTPQPQHE